MFYIEYRKSEGGVTLSSRIDPRDIPSSLRVSTDGKSLYVGEVFDRSDEEFFQCGWEDDPNFLNQGLSALYAVRFDSCNCVFAADVSGRELLYYYISDFCFILSDSFWGILKRIQPSFEDIDKSVLAESITMGGGSPCDYSTPIKGLKWLGANYAGVFNPDAWTLGVHSYADIRRSGEVKDMDEAIEGFDTSMHKMTECLAERHPNAKFGLGLSGGLDSRTALHYLLEAGLDVTCFNVGKSKPHGFLLASSLGKAHKLAAISNVEYCTVEWYPETLREKMNLMLKNQPIGTGGHYTNAYKYETNGRPHFDVLIGGGQAIGPMLVGVSAFDKSDKLGEEDVFAYLMHLAVGEVRAYSYTENSIRKQLLQFGLKNVDTEAGKNADQWNRIVGKESYLRIADKIGRYVKGCVERGYGPSDITLDYRTRALGPTGRNGAYESGLGTEKSYTIYTPFLIREALKWDTPLVEKRRVLKALIAKKCPEYSKIGEETFGSTKVRQSARSLFLQKIEFALRGSGIMTDDWYSRHRVVRELFIEDMANSCEWFYELIPAARDYEGVWEMSPARMNTIWEAKRLIDCIENKNYLEY